MSIPNLHQLSFTANSPFLSNEPRARSTVWHSSHVWIADLSTALVIDGHTRQANVVRWMPGCPLLLRSSRIWPPVIPSSSVTQVRGAGSVALFILRHLCSTRVIGSARFWLVETKLTSIDNSYCSSNSFIISKLCRNSISLVAFVHIQAFCIAVSNNQWYTLTESFRCMTLVYHCKAKLMPFSTASSSARSIC